jgi:hypothetical protein
VILAHVFLIMLHNDPRIAVFVVDEISDDQCGKDARVTGHTFLLAMMNPELENDSKLARMTREYVHILACPIDR